MSIYKLHSIRRLGGVGKIIFIVNLGVPCSWYTQAYFRQMNKMGKWANEQNEQMSKMSKWSNEQMSKMSKYFYTFTNEQYLSFAHHHLPHFQIWKFHFFFSFLRILNLHCWKIWKGERVETTTTEQQQQQQLNKCATMASENPKPPIIMRNFLKLRKMAKKIGEKSWERKRRRSRRRSGGTGWNENEKSPLMNSTGTGEQMKWRREKDIDALMMINTNWGDNQRHVSRFHGDSDEEMEDLG